MGLNIDRCITRGMFQRILRRDKVYSQFVVTARMVFESLKTFIILSRDALINVPVRALIRTIVPWSVI